ncbi:murein hydrolase activator EnvC family protein [Gynurincola endophyticus]|uniref:murein hydrolase activator EnvC family protein n=1 Tax=Gynurincola endophyticus TaxID=2479004 RepID=UPI000F8DDF1D|nr:peptidoglycan DD-metalloendopeptidase family protein [Gynurincola endophyticus]
MIQKLLLLLMLGVLGYNVSVAQSSDELKRQQAAIQDEINQLKKQITEAQKNTKAGLGQLNLIKNQIALREKSIRNISAQIDNIQKDISSSNGEIVQLEKDVAQLKQEYAKSVVYAYKNRNNYDFLNFIFSAPSVNDALKRIEYLKSYRKHRELQSEALQEKQSLLKDKIASLEKVKLEKDEILKKQETEKNSLLGERKEKDAIVASLRGREKELNTELKKKQDADKRLKSAINAAINREVKLAQEEARKKEELAKKNNAANNNKPNNTTTTTTKPATTNTSASVFESTPEALALSGNFEGNKGKMRWPLDQATVKVPFGIYNVEGTKLQGNNPGLTFETVKNGAVKAIFEGVVSSVFEIEGQWAIMIKHGKYFTVYSGLSTSSVAVGDKVTGGKVLGTAGTNADGNGEIEFLIYEERKNVNPGLWLNKR